MGMQVFFIHHSEVLNMVFGVILIFDNRENEAGAFVYASLG